jgi:hypothetical protein
MKKPTPKQILDQIKVLNKIKPTVRQSSMFGDNHHDAIDAQIEVLKHNLTEQMIDDRSAFEDEDDYDDPNKWKTNVREAASAARTWLDGKPLDDAAADLVATWKDLVG